MCASPPGVPWFNEKEVSHAYPLGSPDGFPARRVREHADAAAAARGGGRPRRRQAGATPRPVETRPIGGVDLTGRPAAGASALKDPNNILSKRSVYYEFDKYDVKDE